MRSAAARIQPCARAACPIGGSPGSRSERPEIDTDGVDLPPHRGGVSGRHPTRSTPGPRREAPTAPTYNASEAGTSDRCGGPVNEPAGKPDRRVAGAETCVPGRRSRARCRGAECWPSTAAPRASDWLVRTVASVPRPGGRAASAVGNPARSLAPTTGCDRIDLAIAIIPGRFAVDGSCWQPPSPAGFRNRRSSGTVSGGRAVMGGVRPGRGSRARHGPGAGCQPGAAAGRVAAAIGRARLFRVRAWRHPQPARRRRDANVRAAW